MYKQVSLRNLRSAKERQEKIERLTQTKLHHIGEFSFDEKQVSAFNCENLIGVTQIPLGIAGRLLVRSSQFAVHSYFIPLATTEGALVASVNRGCKAITESGGAEVTSYRVGTTRGPVFRVSDIDKQQTLKNYLKSNFYQLKLTAESISEHLTLIRYETKALGRYFYIRFYFDTQDAMGMNMATVATEKIAQLIYKDLKIKCLSLSGNFCVDKKPAWQNTLQGRGFSVNAAIVLTAEVLTLVLKTTVEEMYQVWLAKCMLGGVASGSLGFNAQAANVIAALYIATGQDPAHVVEGSSAITSVEVIASSKRKAQSAKIKNLYISVDLPSVMVGTVGGGTSLATQKEALEILGVAGGDQGKNAQKLAEIVGAAVLAGEISLLASLAEGSLARAHQDKRKL